MKTWIRRPVTALAVLGPVVLLPASPACGAPCHDYSPHMHFAGNTLRGVTVLDMVLVGDYALTVGGESPFCVVDVSRPAAMNLVATLDLDLVRRALDADGGLVSIAAFWSSGGELESEDSFGALQVVDVSDPRSPVFTGQITFEAVPTDVAMAGHYSYLATGDLVVVDVSNPQTPMVVGQCDFIQATAVIASDGYLFVIDQAAQDCSILRVLDLADPSAPRTVGSLTLAWSCRDLCLDGNRLYLAGSNSVSHTGSLIVVDVSTPAFPTVVATAELPDGAWTVGAEGDVAVVQSELLTGFDMTRPESPRPVGQTRASLAAGRIVARHGYAFLATDTHGLQAYDVSSPTTASYVHAVTVPTDPQDIAVVADLAYAVDGTDGFVVLDVSDPLHPIQVAQEALPASATRRKLSLSGHFAYVASGGLQIIDLSDPLDPRLRGRTTVAQPPFAYQAVAVGDHAYLGTSDGLQIFDVRDPDHPQLRNTLVFDDFLSYLDAWNGHLYLCSSDFFPEWKQTLRVLDLSDPENPELVGSFELPAGVTYTIEVVDGIAYISNGDYVDSYLIVVDVTEPTAPAILGAAHFPNYLHDLLIEDGIGYGASCYCGLSIFDLSDPADPRFLSNMPMTSGALSHAVISLGDHIVLGAGGLSYALRQCATATAVESGSPGPAEAPPAPQRLSVRPNPFSGHASIDFTLTGPQRVRAAVYDVTGRRVAVLADRDFDSGRHSLVWDGKDAAGRDAAPAVYLIRVDGRGTRLETRAVLLRR